MIESPNVARKAFRIANTLILLTVCFFCLFPILHVLAVSLSDKVAASKGEVNLFPVGFNLSSYEYIIKRAEFWRAFRVSVYRCLVGVIVNLFVTSITAYPLSKTTNELRSRTFFVWFFVVTMLFSGGMIPSYLNVKALGLMNNFWALILPDALPIFSVVLMLNFLRTLPKSMEESASLDGAGEWTILFKIALPNMLPVLATLGVFSVVGHWNSWFDGMIYLNNSADYPLQTYMQAILIRQTGKALTRADAMQYQKISDLTIKSAQIFVGTIPVLLVYPFLQRYFISGLVMGSVKE